MSSRFPSLIVILMIAAVARAEEPCHDVGATATTQPAGRVLRIDADANNLPFTNDKLAGLENRIASIIALQARAEGARVRRGACGARGL
jgi:hypothetical protein